MRTAQAEGQNDSESWGEQTGEGGSSIQRSSPKAAPKKIIDFERKDEKFQKAQQDVCARWK